LRTYTVVRTSQEGFEQPYACGYVTFPEGVWLYSLLKGWESGGLEVDMPVKLILDKIAEDSESN
jgi:uncharacterized OB-fold protein